MPTLNLGVVKALHVGLTPPANLNLLWKDTNATPPIMKEFDGFVWNPLASTSTAGRPNARGVFNDSATALPLATTTPIDGLTVVDNDRFLVLDSSTAGEINKVHKATVVSTTITWVVEQDGTGADLPTSGQLIWSESGNLFQNIEWRFDGNQWVLAGTDVRIASPDAGLSDVYVGINNGPVPTISPAGNIGIGQSNLTSINPGGEFDGGRNIATGWEVGDALINGINAATHNILTGRRVLTTATVASFNIFTGYETAQNFEIALSGTNGQSNIGLGQWVMRAVIAGIASFNTFIGPDIAMTATNIGGGNTAMGVSVLADVSTSIGDDNTGIGSFVWRASTTATTDDLNTAVGSSAGRNSLTPMVGSTMVGTEAMRYGGGTSNSIFGRQAGWRINGTGVTALGYQSGHTTDNDYGTGAGTLFTGSNSTFVGHRAGYAIGTPAANNVIVIGTDFQPTLVTDNVYIGSFNDIVFVSDTNGTPFTMTYAANGILNYGTDVSGSYTDRSHIDKGFADATYALLSSAWVSSLTTGDVTAIQNTVISDITGQTTTKTFDGINWNINITGRTSTGEVNFLHFNRTDTSTTSVFKVDIDGQLFFEDGISGFRSIQSLPSQNDIAFNFSGSAKWQMGTVALFGFGSTLAPYIKNGTSSSTNPTLVHNKASLTTGTGGITGEWSAIVGGVEAININATQDVTIPNGTFEITTLPATGDVNPDQILVRDSVTGVLKVIAASGGGTTNFLSAAGTWIAPAGAASSGGNTEVQTSDGSGGFTSDKVFVVGGNITLGDSGLTGSSRSINADGSAGTVDININTKSIGTVFIGNSANPKALQAGDTLIKVSSSTNYALKLEQTAGNDVFMEYSVGAAERYISGIDNTDSDKLKINYGSGTLNPSTGTELFVVDGLNSLVSIPSGGLQLESTKQIIKTVNLQLTQSQIQGAGTTPIQIIAALAAGIYIQVIGVSVFYDHVTSDFVTGSILRLEYSGTSHWETGAGFITASADRTERMDHVGGGDIPLATAVNVGADADSTGGNALSTMDICIQYVEINTN